MGLLDRVIEAKRDLEIRAVEVQMAPAQFKREMDEILEWESEVKSEIAAINYYDRDQETWDEEFTDRMPY